MERAIEYFKDRMEGFDDYYPSMKEVCSMEPVVKWFRFFNHLHDASRRHIRFMELLRLLGGEWSLSYQQHGLRKDTCGYGVS